VGRKAEANVQRSTSNSESIREQAPKEAFGELTLLDCVTLRAQQGYDSFATDHVSCADDAANTGTRDTQRRASFHI
jgi:hypothetical protein